jgi:hypothetical protein
MKMTPQKALNFIPLPVAAADPALDRRTRIVAQLEEQKLLLKDPSYMRPLRSWIKNEQGERSLVEKKQRVLPCWRKQPDGTCVFFVRSGWKPVEFEKGKVGIAARSLVDLPAVIDTLIKAIGEGQFDEQLAQATKQAKPPKRLTKSAA